MRRERIVRYKGITDSLSGHARRYGLCVTTVVWRSQRYGLATKAAKDKVFSQNLLVQKGKGITVNGETRTYTQADGAVAWAFRNALPENAVSFAFADGDGQAEILQGWSRTGIIMVLR